MGMDLTLYPLKKGPIELTCESVLGYERLRFERDYRIFGQLTDMSDPGQPEIPEKPTIKSHEIPPQLWIDMYDVEGCKKRRDDSNGETLRFAYAQQLKRLIIPDDTHFWNKAIKVFLNALPDDTPVILEW